MFLTLLVSTLCIFLMMAPGWLALRKGWLDRSSLRGISAINIYILYPCLIFSVIVRNFTFRSLLHSWYLPAISFGIMIIGYIIGLIATRFIRLKDPDREKSFIFQLTINNYSFFPLALILTLYGTGGTGILVFSTLGAELAVWTVGMFVLSGHKFEWKSLLHLLNPPMVGLYLSIAFLAICELASVDPEFLTHSGTIANSIFNTISTLSGAVIPISMIIVGARLSRINLTDVMNRAVWLLSGLRLIAVPLAAIAIISILPIDTLSRHVMMIVAAMPVSLASMLISEIYGGDKGFVDGTVLLTHLLSMITVPAILAFVL